MTRQRLEVSESAWSEWDPLLKRVQHPPCATSEAHHRGKDLVLRAPVGLCLGSPSALQPPGALGVPIVPLLELSRNVPQTVRTSRFAA